MTVDLPGLASPDARNSRVGRKVATTARTGGALLGRDYRQSGFCESVLRRVTSEDKVAIFILRVAVEAALELCFVDGLAVVELSETPAAGRGVFF